MILCIDALLFLTLGTGVTFCMLWFSEEGAPVLILFTERFLVEEARQIRMNGLPDPFKKGVENRIELLLYYSGIRRHFPFLSARLWIFGGILLSLSVWAGTLLITGRFLTAFLAAGLLWGAWFLVVSFARKQNMRKTEKQLLEFINMAESFTATGEEPVAILSHCACYMRGPVRSTLQFMIQLREQGVPGRILLEQVMIQLEHPKWQEFIYNLNICSRYNSDYTSVFRASRKSIQNYLISKKERMRLKHTAWLELGLLALFGVLILYVLGVVLELSVRELLWGDRFSKGITCYLILITLLFVWKMNAFEKE